MAGLTAQRPGCGKRAWPLFLIIALVGFVDAQPSLLPSTPNWVAAFPKWSGARNASLSYNHEVVAEANASGTVFDVAFYGDSLTALLVLVKENVPVFTQYFGPTWGPTARLGVGGSTVEELAWRILVNGEKLAQDPLVTVVLIGINNALDSQPQDKLEWLLGWMAAAMPRTTIVVVSPLPSAILGKSAALQTAYRQMVQRRPSVHFSTCGHNLDPKNATLYTDGLHLTPSGYRIYFDCLQPLLTSLRKIAATKRQASGLQMQPGLKAGPKPRG